MALAPPVIPAMVFAIVVFDSVTPVSPWLASPTTTSVGSISSVPALPFGAARLMLDAAADVDDAVGAEIDQAGIAGLRAGVELAPPLTVRFWAAFRRISPASPVLLAAVSLAFLPRSMLLPAWTVMLLGVVVLLRAVRRPLTLALLTAPIWIEPLLTLIALALRRPLELTEAANFAA